MRRYRETRYVQCEERIVLCSSHCFVPYMRGVHFEGVPTLPMPDNRPCLCFDVVCLAQCVCDDSCLTNPLAGVRLPTFLCKSNAIQTYEDSVRWLAHVERSLVPPSLAAATAAARPTVAELRGAAAMTDSGSGSGSRTAADLVDVNLNNLSI